MKKFVTAKLHGMFVTDANLNYHGSITLDPIICKEAGIMPLEFVEIWNKNSGARISTYVIFGEPGAGECILNGSAARTCQPGDQVIIAASDYMERKAVTDIKPVVLTFNEDNSIAEKIRYEVEEENDWYSFELITESKSKIEAA